MKWIHTESSFKYNGSPVTRKHASVNTPIGIFQVHEAVSGKVFIQNPLLKSDYILTNPLFIYNNGLEEWFGPTRKPVESFEEGLKINEKFWESYKFLINSFS